MAYAYKNFPFCDILTMTSGIMVGKRGNTNVLLDVMEFMRNDDAFSDEARSAALPSVLRHFQCTVAEVQEELKRQFPELEEIEIPEFAENDSDPKIKFEVWNYIQDTTYGNLRVRSLDRY